MIFADITDREETEVRLLRAVVDASPVATMLTDANGVIIYANTMTERIFGHSLDELSGNNVNTLTPVMVQVDQILEPRTHHTSPLMELTAINKK